MTTGAGQGLTMLPCQGQGLRQGLTMLPCQGQGMRQGLTVLPCQGQGLRQGREEHLGGYAVHVVDGGRAADPQEAAALGPAEVPRPRRGRLEIMY